MAMVDGVAGAIHARAFSVPHGEYAIDLAVFAHTGLLRTHHHSCAEVFVDCRQKADLMLIQMRLGAPHRQVNTTQRRAAIASDESGGIRSEEHTSELQSLMRISYAVFCLKKKKKQT